MLSHNDEKICIRKVAVIGLGLMGGSLCRAIRRFLPEVELIGVDFQPVLHRAVSLRLVDKTFQTSRIAEACHHVDLIFIATPISKSLALLPVIAEAAGRETIVTDVCSIKVPLMEKAQQVFPPGRGIFIGGHPMAGSEKPGLEHADPFLFQNAMYVLSPLADTPQTAVAAVTMIVQGLGAQVVLLDAETHDRIAATVSHLPQILSVALMQHVARKNGEKSLYLKMAGGGFRDMTRIASSPVDIWKDICEGNREKILDEIDAFADVLQEMKAAVESGQLRAPFERAARTRRSIPVDIKGFLTPHFDLSVEVEDKPGGLAVIYSTLAEAAINIKDIEVMKVRENEGGTLRLSFASETDCHRSHQLLHKKGFKCNLR